MVARKSKTPKKSPQVRVLVPRADGKGALMSGGTNRGGTGRPRDDFRARLRSLAKEPFFDYIESVLADPTHNDYWKAVDTVLKFGIGTANETEVTRKDERTREEKIAYVEELINGS
jgi:hypothetical protein